jgi:hypothetical protein
MLLPTGLVVLTLLIAVVALIVHVQHRAEGRSEPY